MLKKSRKLGVFEGIEMNVDFRYLEKEAGFRKEIEIFERILGWIMVVGAVAFLIFIFLTFYEISQVKISWEILLVDSVTGVIMWVCIGIITYGTYLIRNRDLFLDRISIDNLDHLRQRMQETNKEISIDVSKFFDHDLINIFDDILSREHQNYVLDLLYELFKFKHIIVAADRLGLEKQQRGELLEKLKKIKLRLSEEELTQLLKGSFELALDKGFHFVDEMAVFMYIVKGPLNKYLLEYEINELEIDAMVVWVANQAKKRRYIQLIKTQSTLKPTSTVNRSYTSVFSPTLVEFSRDFTMEVIRGNFTLSYAHQKELDELVELVSSSNSTATLVLGKPGVGKTTLIKDLALRMVVEDVPEIIKDMRLVGFDFNRAYALAANEQKFKAIVEQVIEEVIRAKNIIMVMDDIDEFAGVRKELSAEVVNLITDAMDRGQIKIIASSTIEGYSKYIKPYKAFAALFNTITINEPSDELAAQILFDIVPELEQKYKLAVEFEVISRVVKLSHRYAFEKVLPDKAINLLEEVMLHAYSQRGVKEVKEEMVDEVVAKKVGVEVGKISGSESQKLINLETELHKKVIGQHHAVTAVSAALRRSRAGLTSQSRPIASFLFFGPTGVGKTELSKAVTELYFGDKKFMIRLDMSEYQEEENLKRLIGTTEDGEFTGGYLSEAVRAKPYSLILLDEIEKANAKVLDLFLQVLDEGKMTDGLGREINFANTIIIATSNIAANEIADRISRGEDYKTVSEAVIPELRQYLRIEFLNRFDKLIMFKSLHKVEMQQIAGLMMSSLSKQMQEKGIVLQYTTKLLEELVELGYNPLYGAREMRRVIQDNVEDRLAEMIINGRIKAGSQMTINSLQDIK